MTTVVAILAAGGSSRLGRPKQLVQWRGRSLLQTSQTFPTVGSQTEGFQKNADGSFDVYFGPKAPKGQQGNWLQTMPGKSWFAILRMYGPLQPWIDKTWRPSEIELVK